MLTGEDIARLADGTLRIDAGEAHLAALYAMRESEVALRANVALAGFATTLVTSLLHFADTRIDSMSWSSIVVLLAVLVTSATWFTALHRELVQLRKESTVAKDLLSRLRVYYA